MFKFHSKKIRAFTLIETLVAVSIFSISILAVMATISKGISDTGYTKKKIIATYLAQEGIEYIRNLRDTYMLYHLSGASAGWVAFNGQLSGGSCIGGNGCYFDDRDVFSAPGPMQMASLIFGPCSSSSSSVCSNNPLRYSASGEYGYASGSPSGFARRVIVSTINSDEVQVSSTVSWNQGSGTYTMTFSENLFNWIEQ